MMIPAEMIKYVSQVSHPKAQRHTKFRVAGLGTVPSSFNQLQSKQSQAKTLDLTFNSRARLPGSVSLLLLVTKEVHVCKTTTDVTSIDGI